MIQEDALSYIRLTKKFSKEKFKSFEELADKAIWQSRRGQ